MSYKSSCKKSWRKFLASTALFFSKGLVVGKWELKWTWRF